MERESTGEISLVVFNFGLILEREIESDKRKYNEDNPHYGVFRALKNTLRSGEFENMRLTLTDYHGIVNHLLEGEHTSEAFRDWVRISDFEWEHGWFSKNTSRLFVVGKREISSRNGGKGKH